MSRIGDQLDLARAEAPQVAPEDLAERQREGAVVVDIRTAATRLPEGHLPGAIVVDRLVLEWRLDLTSGATLTGGPAYDDEVIVVCNEGYASTLAARDLRALGFTRATDLAGGFRAYAAAGLPTQPEPAREVR